MLRRQPKDPLLVRESHHCRRLLVVGVAGNNGGSFLIKARHHNLKGAQVDAQRSFVPWSRVRLGFSCRFHLILVREKNFGA